jgi:hypothetical protein
MRKVWPNVWRKIWPKVWPKVWVVSGLVVMFCSPDDWLSRRARLAKGHALFFT